MPTRTTDGGAGLNYLHASEGLEDEQEVGRAHHDRAQHEREANAEESREGEVVPCLVRNAGHNDVRAGAHLLISANRATQQGRNAAGNCVRVTRLCRAPECRCHPSRRLVRVPRQGARGAGGGAAGGRDAPRRAPW
eukprot:scaffold1123_cov347-Prasinococcus_capsulatus_cf.AAC.11